MIATRPLRRGRPLFLGAGVASAVLIAVAALALQACSTMTPPVAPSAPDPAGAAIARTSPGPQSAAGPHRPATAQSPAGAPGLTAAPGDAIPAHPPRSPDVTALRAHADDREGRRIAVVYCSGCHAIGTSGKSAHPDAPPFRTLSQKYPVDDLAEAFAEGIRVGHKDMPEFRLEPDQINDLIAYLQSVQPRKGG